MLSRTKQDYLKNNGWSSSKFFDIAKYIIEALESKDFELDFGRTVIYIKKINKLIKVYVHFNGRSNDYITFTDSKGYELQSFHYSVNANDILKFILIQF